MGFKIVEICVTFVKIKYIQVHNPLPPSISTEEHLSETQGSTLNAHIYIWEVFCCVLHNIQSQFLIHESITAVITIYKHFMKFYHLDCWWESWRRKLDRFWDLNTVVFLLFISYHTLFWELKTVVFFGFISYSAFYLPFFYFSAAHIRSKKAKIQWWYK